MRIIIEKNTVKDGDSIWVVSEQKIWKRNTYIQINYSNIFFVFVDKKILKKYLIQFFLS